MLNTLFKEYQKISRGPEEFKMSVLFLLKSIHYFSLNICFSLCSLVVHLVCQANRGSYKLISIFIDGAASDSSPSFQKLDPAIKTMFSEILVSISFCVFFV